MAIKTKQENQLDHENILLLDDDHNSSIEPAKTSEYGSFEANQKN